MSSAREELAALYLKALNLIAPSPWWKYEIVWVCNLLRDLASSAFCMPLFGETKHICEMI